MKDTKSNSSPSDHNSDRYNHQKIEAHWQSQWEKDELYETLDPLPNQKCFYALSMFPYPSGTLHMGHVRNYVITDVIARYQRMSGAAVLHPMGWDSFGLPAENAAIERGVDTAEWTERNIKQMKSQLNRLGLSIDWNKEITTCDPNYYKWTQYIFLKLHKSGLAYQKKANVNWDPIDQTVLANEQVDSEGKSWRSGAVVEQRELNQWFLGITKYGDQLLEGLSDLKGWPDRVKLMQSNWIGQSKGLQIEFTLASKTHSKINVFTTRPDTLFGVTYLVLSPNYQNIKDFTSDDKLEELKEFILKSNKLSEIDRNSENRVKNGMFLGHKVVNPVNGEIIELWTGDYVLSGYGTGAVMGVPAHDQRDYLFATKYNLPIKYVVKNNTVELDTNKPYLEEGILINSNEFTGKKSLEAKKLIRDYGIRNGWANEKIEYKLRDWLISRQRYWGCPIPIINCTKCGQVRVPDADLPVLLPKNIKLTGKGHSALNDNEEWINVKCPKCSNQAKRETDTMDTFMCSSWYFLRYVDSLNKNSPFDKEKVNKWLPVNQYVGGIEHAILHLLYSRFITKALKSAGIVDINEPFDNLLTQGMVQSITYKNRINNKYIPIKDIKDINNPIDPNTGEKLDVMYEKMSKSKYNGIDPAEVIDKYGADTARMFILFKAPCEKDLEWEDSDVEGQFRFIQRIYSLIKEYSMSNELDFSNTSDIFTNKYLDNISDIDKEMRSYVHTAISNITNNLEDLKLNTAISQLMILSNKLKELNESISRPIAKEGIEVLLKLLSPFAPHLSEQIWKEYRGEGSIHLQNWPKVDQKALQKDTYELVIQINGKVRAKQHVSKKLNEIELEELSLRSDHVKKWLEGKSIKRTIVVPGKLVNIVI
ncbi:leucine--tRNA ligase [Prochlorococcus sp. MIT 1223]|uniref:leucine--tRNA ligase n=1 Tax=Prochlorococcus sp. MIT 1223 TaxID=3096217 RepID=UPI002A764554|nr:leucine--tRNA ligase [Prochlorococcus sp. MIT 1223]